VHGPFTPAARHKDLFTNEVIVRSANAKDTLDGKPVMQRIVNGQSAVGPQAVGSSDELIRNQLRCLTAIDEGVGRILKTLEETKPRDQMVHVFEPSNRARILEAEDLLEAPGLLPGFSVRVSELFA
jgi:hypothetical protein